MKQFAFIARILVGLVFIFSGFVKGVDPTGVQYIMHDYIDAYGWDFLNNLIFVGSFALCMLEFTVGVLLVCNILPRITLVAVTLMMVYFTGTTLYDAIFDPVHDCGCFGSAIKLTNWETFYKNVVLDVLLVVAWLRYKGLKPWISCKKGFVVGFAVAFVFLGFEIYNYRYLPVVNFLDWKVGRRMLEENPQPIKYYFTYKNKTTGDVREFESSALPSTTEWEYVSRRDEDPNKNYANINILDVDGMDVTRHLLTDPSFNFIIAAYDLAQAEGAYLDSMISLASQMEEQGYYYVILTASSPEDVEAYQTRTGRSLPFFFADDTGIKAMIRSNPGLILMRNSVVLGLWGKRMLPDYEKLKALMDGVE
ncbi:MAG: hypothetical protein LBC49_03455 [Bacteroidales bacterium]|jgi:uncharacterized membrane protein YphA (DoxX/SURF4 family)|nr:hypothetical protein [Bacteroidales bacterium]